MVARTGFHAMMKDEADVGGGWKNKLQSTLAIITPAGLLAGTASEYGRTGIGFATRFYMRPRNIART